MDAANLAAVIRSASHARCQYLSAFMRADSHHLYKAVPPPNFDGSS